MKAASYGDARPIAAIATPLGESALAVVRVSGGGVLSSDSQSALELLSFVFSRPRALGNTLGNSIIHGWIVEPETSPRPNGKSTDRKKIDEVLISVYRGPKSYTGEDGADISCHGGIAAVKAVMAALKRAGFREALPGEFTFRAFMNGKLDLTRAESVMEIVAAKTSPGRERAVRRLAGVLEKEIAAIKEALVEVLAGTEIYLDYSEDEFFDTSPDEAAGRLPGRARAEEAAAKLKRIADSWRRERLYAEGALAVLAGRPNAGKSSIFNYLLREDRSIVTAVPGTTRDWIEALVSVEDIPLRLADTAGLRKIDPEKNDEAERIGIERSLELLGRADIVLYVIDGNEGVTPADTEFIERQKEAAPKKPLLVVWNKSDIAPPPGGRFAAVSAKTGEGIPEMTRSIAGLLTAAAGAGESRREDEVTGPGSLRQKELIDAAIASVDEALLLADRGEPLDIIAPLFRAAVNALGEITGEVSNSDILEAMFSRFCVGK